MSASIPGEMLLEADPATSCFRNTDVPEGEMTDACLHGVQSLPWHSVPETWNWDQFILLGKGEENTWQQTQRQHHL